MFWHDFNFKSYQQIKTNENISLLVKKLIIWHEKSCQSMIVWFEFASVWNEKSCQISKNKKINDLTWTIMSSGIWIQTVGTRHQTFAYSWALRWRYRTLYIYIYIFIYYILSPLFFYNVFIYVPTLILDWSPSSWYSWCLVLPGRDFWNYLGSSGTFRNFTEPSLFI